jgi:MFS-type transporter involved in bile tolerance (Atg22 family)
VNIPPIIYIGLILVAIISVVMANIAKYAWRSRKWTLVFAVAGSLSVLSLILTVWL